MAYLISIIAQGIEYGAKIIQILESGWTIVETVRDQSLSTRAKVQRVVINGFFIVAQGTEIGTHYYKTSLKSQLITKALSGTGDVARIADRGAGFWDIIATGGYRVVDMGGCYMNHCPDASVRAKAACDAMETALMLYADREKICQAALSLKKRATVIFQRGRFFRYEIQINDHQQDPPPAVAAPNIPVPDFRVVREEIENPTQLGQEVEDVLRTRDISEWTAIPNIFRNDLAFASCVCPIAQAPIRFPLVVTDTAQTENPVFYERAAILQWFEQHPNQPPEGWPERVPLQKASLSGCPPMQGQINRWLQLLLEDTRRSVDIMRRISRPETTEAVGSS